MARPLLRPAQVDPLRAMLHRPWAWARARWSPPACHHVVVAVRVLRTFEELAIGLVRGLRQRGRPAVLHRVRDFEDAGPVRHGDRVLAFGVHRFGAFPRRPGVLYVGLQSEQFPMDWKPGEAGHDVVQKADDFLACCDLLWASNECLAAEGARLGRRADAVLPFAWVPEYAPAESAVAGADREFDAAFLGRLETERRRRALTALGARFALNPDTVAWGRGRGRFLRSARVQLGLHQRSKPELAGHRLALTLSHGAFLLSEPLPPEAPFRAGVHYAAATVDELPDALEHYLRDEEARTRIAREGARFFCEEYTLESAIDRLLPQLDEAAAERTSD